jgi:hypothetical protein
MVSGPMWARLGTNGGRACARHGCEAPAIATLHFEPVRREVWLVDLNDGSSRSEHDFCARHARPLALPSGWELCDGRGGGAASLPPPRRAVLRRRRRVLTPVPPPDPARAEAATDHAEVAGESLSNVLDARTPLLRRAFQNVWPFSDDS